MPYRPTEKTESRKAAVRQTILDTAKKQVLSLGFARLTMSAVADAAGLATGTLYRHFDSKNALCIELFCQASGLEVEQLDTIARQLHLSADQKLIAMVECFLLRAFKGSRLAWALIAEPLDPVLEAQRLEYRQAYGRVFKKVIEEGIERQWFQFQEPTISATAMVGALAESLVKPLNPDNDLPAPEQQQALVDHMTCFCLLAVGASQSQVTSLYPKVC